MSKYDIVRHYPITNPQQYFQAQAKSLEAQIKEVNIPPDQERQIVEGTTRKLVRDNLLGTFKIGQIIKIFFNCNDNINNEIRNAKKDILIEKYFEMCDKNNNAILTLTNLTTSPQGNTVFNKILRILDDTPPDKELTNHLASALKHIIETDFISMFEEHKYAISLIEHIRPQALTILADYKNWPPFHMNIMVATNGKIQDGWLNNFSHSYCERKQIKDIDIGKRITHSIDDLIKNRLIEAHPLSSENIACTTTEIGKLLLPYLSRASV